MAGDHNVNIHGGTFSGPMAFGEGAQAVQNLGTPDLIERLVRLTEAHSSELAEPGDALRDAREVAEEAQREKPDSGRILAALSRLADHARPVGALAEVIAKLISLFKG